MRGKMKQKEVKFVISDLDGTLLDESYSFEGAEEALKLLREKNIPLILCSSKTRAEIELYRERLSLKEYPFISENGGGIFLPSGEDYEIISLGVPHSFIVEILKKAKEALGLNFKGFHELSVEEVARVSGLSLKEADLAKRRDFSETILIDDELAPSLESFLKKHGLKLTKGSRFYSVTGDNDKGKAVRILRERFKNIYSGCEVVFIGLGDGENDLPMLKEVDYPVLVRGKSGRLPELNLHNLYVTEQPGPFGWAEAIFKILRG